MIKEIDVNKVFFINMIGGVSGDMLIGGLVSLGVEISEINQTLSLLPLKGIELTEKDVKRGSIKAVLVEPVFSKNLLRKTFNWDDFFDLILNSKLDDDIKNKSIRVLNKLVEAEEKIHGGKEKPHELGSIDTLVDIVSVIVGFKILNAEKIYASPFPFNTGTIKIHHGVVSSLAPATLEIISSANAPLSQVNSDVRLGELVTPTGSALVTEMCVFDKLEMKLEKIGYGAGVKNPENYSNVVSIWQGRQEERKNTDNVLLIESNIDDNSGEIFGFTTEKLLNNGALDVWMTPIFMKKNRPAYKISVLCDRLKLSSLSEILMNETSTFGIRVSELKRYKSKREIIKLKTVFGMMSIKVRFNINGKDYFPEYEECRKVALQKNIPLMKVYQEVQNKIKIYLGKMPQ
tara:strand:+ start:947 stop:2155 length:1209 start_codon:yes stop_codon:yes gene_type:complete